MILTGQRSKLKTGFINIPPNYEQVLTEDGSYTLYSKKYDENCHSTSGADGETEKYFLIDSHLNHDLKTSQTIFETGFGIGKSFLAVKKSCEQSKNKIHFISTEIDPNLVIWFFKEYFNLQKLSQDIIEHDFEYIKITILIGDATETTKAYFQDKELKVDKVFQDAFSPKKNPTLWTKSWFEILKSISNETVTLTTYSASHSIRKNLEDAGWKIENLKGFGKKRSATRATLI